MSEKLTIYQVYKKWKKQDKSNIDIYINLLKENEISLNNGFKVLNEKNCKIKLIDQMIKKCNIQLHYDYDDDNVYFNIQDAFNNALDLKNFKYAIYYLENYKITSNNFIYNWYKLIIYLIKNINLY